jgi:hypothetical protein
VHGPIIGERYRVIRVLGKLLPKGKRKSKLKKLNSDSRTFKKKLK